MFQIETYSEWEHNLKMNMQYKGWTCDLDTDETLGFSFKEGDSHWMRDYNKKTRSFVQFDGNQKVNIDHE